jgi:hypothetical protein
MQDSAMETLTVVQRGKEFPPNLASENEHRFFFYFHVTVHRNKFLCNKTDN